jgi:hypothetical protein
MARWRAPNVELDFRDPPQGPERPPLLRKFVGRYEVRYPGPEKLHDALDALERIEWDGISILESIKEAKEYNSGVKIKVPKIKPPPKKKWKRPV